MPKEDKDNREFYDERIAKDEEISDMSLSVEEYNQMRHMEEYELTKEDVDDENWDD